MRAAGLAIWLSSGFSRNSSSRSEWNRLPRRFANSDQAQPQPLSLTLLCKSDNHILCDVEYVVDGGCWLQNLLRRLRQTPKIQKLNVTENNVSLVGSGTTRNWKSAP